MDNLFYECQRCKHRESAALKIDKCPNCGNIISWYKITVKTTDLKSKTDVTPPVQSQTSTQSYDQRLDHPTHLMFDGDENSKSDYYFDKLWLIRLQIFEVIAQSEKPLINRRVLVVDENLAQKVYHEYYREYQQYNDKSQRYRGLIDVSHPQVTEYGILKPVPRLPKINELRF